jgi:hypothetical protein
LVNANGSKWWRFRYRFGGLEKSLSMGVFPKVALAEARRRRDDYRALLERGRDPAERRAAERLRRISAGTSTKRTPIMVSSTPLGGIEIRRGQRTLRFSADDTRVLRQFLTGDKRPDRKGVPRCR